MATNGHKMASDSTDGDTADLFTKAPVILQEELTMLHNLFPGTTLHARNPKSQEMTVGVPCSQPNLEAVFSFHLPQNYPLRVPDIYLTSHSISKSDINDIIKSLDLICIGILGQPMLVCCVEEGARLLMNIRGQGDRKKGKRKQRRMKKMMMDENLDEGKEDEKDLNCSEKTFSDPLSTTTDDEPCVFKMDIAADSLPVSSATEEKKLPARANYFVAIRISNEALIENLAVIQKSLVDQEALLSKGVIPTAVLHITLCNLGLDHADDLLRTMEALRRMKCELQSILPCKPLVIHGASQFYDRAIYAKVRSEEDFLVFRDAVIRKLNDSGIKFREDHDQYTPHVTLIKVRRPERRMFGNRPIRPQIYWPYLESVHGEQMVDAVYLCAMDGNKREDGFYVTPYELQFERL